VLLLGVFVCYVGMLFPLGAGCAIRSVHDGASEVGGGGGGEGAGWGLCERRRGESGFS
jgi:hypothetical protein